MKLISRNVLAALGLCVFALNAHSLSGGPISGQVIDETTGRPVSDAIVVVHWNGSWTKIVAESSSACYHVETARTDVNGRYQIAAWKTPWAIDDLRFSSNGQTYHVYKPGYARGVSRGTAPEVFSMAPYKGSVAWYFKNVLSAPYWGCERAGASSKNEYRLFKAMAQEADALAETPEQRETGSWRRRLAQQSLVNRDKPTDYVGGRLVNIDPKDSFKEEEVPQ